jgi:hypothetical protein
VGHGPARTLESSNDVDRTLDPEASARLAAALAKLDRVDAEFKSNRDDIRYQQRVKAWGAKAKEIDGYLRTAGAVLYAGHQLNLDIGSEGGGAATKPFFEESGRKIDRLYFKMEEGEAIAYTGQRVLGKKPMDEVSYEWVEQMSVDWIIFAIESKR